jgi:hypothetical protein
MGESSGQRERAKIIQKGLGKVKNMDFTTEEAVHAIDQFKSSGTKREMTGKVSDTGKRIMDDLDNIAGKTQHLLTEKNAGEHFQQMILHAKRATEMTNLQPLKAGSSSSQDVRKSLSFSYSSIVSAVTLIVKSAEFRGSMRELLNIILEIIKFNMGVEDSEETSDDPTGGLMSSISSLQEEKNKIKQGSTDPRNAAHNVVDIIADASQTPMGSKISETVSGTVVSPLGSAKSSGHNRNGHDDWNNGETWEMNRDNRNRDEDDWGKDSWDSTNRSSTRDDNWGKDPRDRSTWDDHDHSPNGNRNMNRDDNNERTMTSSSSEPVTAASAKGRMSLEKIREKSKNIKNITIPEEHKERLINRLRDNLRVFRSRPEFQKALDDLFSGLDNLYSSTTRFSKETMEKGKSSVTDNQAEQEWKTAFDHARDLLENIFNGRSLAEVIDAVRVFITEVQNDATLSENFARWKSFIEGLLHDPTFADSPAFRNEAKRLSNEMGTLVEERYKRRAQDVVDNIQFFTSGLNEDLTTQELLDAVRELWTDMFLDDNGRLTYKPELFTDLANIMPIITDKLAMVPIPHIEVDNGDIFFSLDDCILNCSQILPRHIRWTISGDLNLQVPQATGELSVSITNVLVSARDVLFSLNRKTGFPKFTETGKVDFAITRGGLSADLKYVPWIKQGGERGLDLVSCNTHLDKLKIRIHDTKKHHLLYRIFKWSIERVIKAQIVKIMNEKMAELCDPQRKRTGD